MEQLLVSYELITGAIWSDRLKLAKDWLTLNLRGDRCTAEVPSALTRRFPSGVTLHAESPNRNQPSGVLLQQAIFMSRHCICTKKLHTDTMKGAEEGGKQPV